MFSGIGGQVTAAELIRKEIFGIIPAVMRIRIEVSARVERSPKFRIAQIFPDALGFADRVGFVF